MDTVYANLLSAWESQQTALIEMREERFTFMMDVIKNINPKVKNILDAGCGPGSFTLRLAKKFPEAIIFSIDYDPVLLKIAKNNVRDYGNRINIMEYDLTGNDWLKQLSNQKFDAIVSTTALHWIPVEKLDNLYADFYSILNNNGIFLDGDHFRSIHDSEYIIKLYSEIRKNISERNLASSRAMNWEEWWKYIENNKIFNKELKLRSERYPESSHDQNITLEQHIDILNKSAFNSTGVIWQYLDNRVLFSRR
ncbi:class I SAM-dependent methyltransferase [Ferroplasma sp.]|uniref:class I SAM-dependent methyltransferase n=1 Tax=Ferroplasma sp. TaxID=2591003 RepID=UPI00307F526E